MRVCGHQCLSPKVVSARHRTAPASSPVCRCYEYFPPIFVPLQCLLYPIPLRPHVFRILLARPLLLLLDGFGKRIDLPLQRPMETRRDRSTRSREER